MISFRLLSRSHRRRIYIYQRHLQNTPPQTAAAFRSPRRSLLSLALSLLGRGGGWGPGPRGNHRPNFQKSRVQEWNALLREHRPTTPPSRMDQLPREDYAVVIHVRIYRDVCRGTVHHPGPASQGINQSHGGFASGGRRRRSSCVAPAEGAALLPPP